MSVCLSVHLFAWFYPQNYYEDTPEKPGQESTAAKSSRHKRRKGPTPQDARNQHEAAEQDVVYRNVPGFSGSEIRR